MRPPAEGGLFHECAATGAFMTFDRAYERAVRP
jgi:hypothetical protein